MEVGDDAGNILVPGNDARVLHHAWGADEAELLKFDHLVDQPPGPVAKSEPPTGHAVGLAETVKDDYFLVELGRAAKRLIVAEDAVDLVAEQ